MTYPILWFDLDNTLLDFSSASKKAFSALLKHIGVEEKDNSYDQYSVINKAAWLAYEQKKIDNVELKKVRFQNYFDAYEIDYDGFKANQLYLQHIAEHPIEMPGAKDLLDTLKAKGYHLSVITNGMKEVQRPRMLNLKWEHYFDHFFVSDEIGLAKPNIEFFEHCHEVFKNKNKGDILVIGDSLESDILGGNNFGVDTCWLNLNNRYCPPDIQPTFKISDISEVINLV